MTARLALLVVVLGALALPLTIGRGSGGNTARGADIAWEKAPAVFIPRGMPRDRVAMGTIRNDSFAPVRLVASRVAVTTMSGRRLRSASGFTSAFAHGLWGAFQQPSASPTAELIRLGKIVELKPGEKAPLFAAFRLPKGVREPVRIDYGTGTLSLPAARELTAP